MCIKQFFCTNNLDYSIKNTTFALVNTRSRLFGGTGMLYFECPPLACYALNRT